MWALKKTVIYDILLFAIRIVIGCMFIYSAMLKLGHPYEFLVSIYDYQMLGAEAGLVAAMTLPAVMLIVGLCMITGLWLDGAVLTGALLMLLFSVALCFVICRGIPADCGCFARNERITMFTIARSLILLLTLIILFMRLLRGGAEKSIVRMSL